MQSLFHTYTLLNNKHLTVLVCHLCVIEILLTILPLTILIIPSGLHTVHFISFFNHIILDKFERSRKPLCILCLCAAQSHSGNTL